MAQIELIGGPMDGQSFWSSRVPPEWSHPLMGRRRQIAIYVLESINSNEDSAVYIYKETISPFQNQI